MKGSIFLEVGVQLLTQCFVGGVARPAGGAIVLIAPI
jgi:hypothetical protein